MADQILVVGTHLDDNSNVLLPTISMNALNLNNGDTVIATKTIQTSCTVSSNDSDENIHLDVNARNSLSAQIGDYISIKACHVEDGKLVEVAPNDDCAVGLSKSNASEKILSYFKEQVQAKIVVHEGDTLLFEGLEFKVIKTDPSPFCRVTSETKLNCGEPIKTNIVPVSQVNTVRDHIFQLSTACGALMEKNKEQTDQINNLREVNRTVLNRMGSLEKRTASLEKHNASLEKRTASLEKNMKSLLVSSHKFASATEQIIKLFKEEIKKVENDLVD